MYTSGQILIVEAGDGDGYPEGTIFQVDKIHPDNASYVLGKVLYRPRSPSHYGVSMTVKISSCKVCPRKDIANIIREQNDKLVTQRDELDIKIKGNIVKIRMCEKFASDEEAIASQMYEIFERNKDDRPAMIKELSKMSKEGLKLHIL